MSPAKHFSISLAVDGPDGFHRSSRWEVTPTGTLDTEPGSLWILLQGSLGKLLTTLGDAALVFSRHGRPEGLGL